MLRVATASRSKAPASMRCACRAERQTRAIPRPPGSPSARVTMNDPRDRQAAFNASSRDQWDGSRHRGTGRGAPRAAGTRADPTLRPRRQGNGNDSTCPRSWRPTRGASGGPRRRGPRAASSVRGGGPPLVRRHGGLDVTGISMRSRAGPADPDPARRPGGPRRMALRRVGLALPGPFDLVASTCLLSPLIGNVLHAVGERPPPIPGAGAGDPGGPPAPPDPPDRARGHGGPDHRRRPPRTFPTLGSVPETRCPVCFVNWQSGEVLPRRRPGDLMQAFRQTLS
jgi:hypothetical protein